MIARRREDRLDDPTDPPPALFVSNRITTMEVRFLVFHDYHARET